MKYKDFINLYGALIDVLDVYDEDGCEIDEERVLDDAEVLGFENDCGLYSITVSGEYPMLPV